jgi:hypothetical protein
MALWPHIGQIDQPGCAFWSLCLQFRTPTPAHASQLGGMEAGRFHAIIRSMRFSRSQACNRHASIAALTLLLWMSPARTPAQTMPATPGETLSGQRIVLANAIRGRAAVLIFGFSRDASDGCAAWAKTLHADPVMAGTLVYESAMLESAPGFVRGLIENSMRKNMSQQDQDRFVVFTRDEKLWRGYFAVSNDKDPYVVFLDASGNVLWHGHGEAKTLESSLSKAKP